MNEVQAEIQGRNLEAETEVEAMGGSFLLTFYLKLVQYAFLCNTDTHSYTWKKVKKSFFKRPSKPLKLFFSVYCDDQVYATTTIVYIEYVRSK